MQFQYSLEGNWLNNIEQEKDLGVTINQSLKPTAHCNEMYKKASSRLKLISRNIEYKSAEVIRKLYCAQVRPFLEYCVQFSHPYLIHDIDQLEKVQKRATKLIPSLKHLNYKDRLEELNMFSLKKRRLRGDMIEVYKIINNIDKVESSKFFILIDTNVTRGHVYKLKKTRFNSTLYQHSFSNRVVGFWNSLSTDVVTAGSLHNFKSKLDTFMASKGIW